ncbi:murein DD-endopeptidase MepM/ murein hydrolase activator NlpD [Amycolatopsis jiangsuensis]|uniref:Murein DD-endopeptidase MepM/ murein hydrolase activator NlpD n=1 Tax=Amycolatopsis jiangsuensis TaxID=1181879 RepID=A0A840IV16_9PSEU|nr:murein DD-endopeptidase MepM/ murein hydrolase activator NlpD [Amycolatopsis jiangsuensis]
MASHRSPGGQAPSPALKDALDGAVIRVRGQHRIAPPSSALRGRVVVAAVAAGAFAAAAAGQTLKAANSTDSDTTVKPLANAQDASASFTLGSASSGGAPELLPAGHSMNAADEAAKMADSAKITEAREKADAEAARKAAEEAARPKTCMPAHGTFTSGFGARWGASHLGIDIANSIGSPIYAASDGTVIDAGPAHGFGLWVRIQLDDGTIQVYGHMNSFSVSEGQKVKCGEQIAEIGQRGQSTGPHLHFEVWQNGSKKIDPRPWLAARGVDV